MTIPGRSGRRRHTVPLPTGDPGRITPMTRILWAPEHDMPLGADGRPKNAIAEVDEDGTVIVLREGLAAAIQNGEVRRLIRILRQLGAGRPSAWVIITAEGLRQCGWRFLRVLASASAQSAAQTAGEHLIPTVAGTMLAAGAAGTAVVLSVNAGHGGPACQAPTSAQCAAWHRHHPVHVTLPGKPLSYLGAFEQSSPAGYGGMETFARTAGRQPNVALYYSGWWQPFQMAFALQAALHGAIPLVQINPEIGTNGSAISLAAIANGAYDGYLINYADAVATYHKAVIIGFGHEMNGWWYPWGRPRQSQEFVAAWRHVVDVFRRQGAYNVTWLWTVNVLSGKKPAALSQWWPGANYVTWVGIDGYYRSQYDTWSSVFGPTIAEVGQITGDPILIAETAIGPIGTEPWQLSDMYASIRQSNYLGLVWFDENKPGLAYRLEDPGKNAALIRQTFQQETKAWRLTHQRGPHTKAVSAQRMAEAAARLPQVVAGAVKESRPAASSSARRITAAIAGTSSLPSAKYLRPSYSTSRWGSSAAPSGDSFSSVFRSLRPALPRISNISSSCPRMISTCLRSASNSALLGGAP